MVFAYAEGHGTAEEVAKENGLHCGSSVWRAVDAALEQVEEWIKLGTTFLKKHHPEALDQLLCPLPPVCLVNRRFRQPKRIQLLALLREVPRWAKACIQALGKEWPYGALRFMRSIAPRFAEACGSQ